MNSYFVDLNLILIKKIDHFLFALLHNCARLRNIEKCERDAKMAPQFFSKAPLSYLNLLFNSHGENQLEHRSMEAVSITTSIFKLFKANIITIENQKEVAKMNAQRAEEIASSPIMANVTYNGESIYIEHVDEQNGTVTIHSLDEPNNKQSVSVTSLNEQ